MSPDHVRSLALRDGRFSPDAFVFLFESLDTAIRVAGREGAKGAERHVTGKELLEGMREHAAEIFGPIASHVWRSWGIHETLDWGRVVFLLVDEEMLNSQPTDTIDDFRDGFDFDEAFIESYEPELPLELGPEGN